MGEETGKTYFNLLFGHLRDENERSFISSEKRL